MLFCFMRGDVQANGWYPLEIRRPGRVAPRRDGRCKDSAAGKRAHAPDTTPKHLIPYNMHADGFAAEISAMIRFLMLTSRVS